MEKDALYRNKRIGFAGSILEKSRLFAPSLALCVLGSCSITDIDFTTSVRVVGLVTDQEGVGVSGAQVTVTTLATSCTGSFDALVQGFTDSSGRFALGVGTTGRSFEGCIEVATEPGANDAFARVVVRLDSVQVANVVRDSVPVVVQVVRD